MKTIMLDSTDRITFIELNDPHPFGKFVIQFGGKVQVFCTAKQVKDLHDLLKEVVS